MRTKTSIVKSITSVAGLATSYFVIVTGLANAAPSCSDADTISTISDILSKNKNNKLRMYVIQNHTIDQNHVADVNSINKQLASLIAQLQYYGNSNNSNNQCVKDYWHKDKNDKFNYGIYKCDIFFYSASIDELNAKFSSFTINGQHLTPDASDLDYYKQHYLPLRQQIGEVQDSLKNSQKIQQEYVSQQFEEFDKTVAYNVDTIRTKSVDHDTGAVMCVGRISINSLWGGISGEFPYEVENTSDGNIYVTLSGI